MEEEEVCESGEQFEQYFYRVCWAKTIYERGDIDASVLQGVLDKLEMVKRQDVLKEIYRQV